MDMKRLVALIAGLLAGVAWASATATPALAQTVTLNPSSGTPGTRVTVSGSGFQCPGDASNESVSVSLDDAATTDDAEDGAFTAALTVPDATSPGKHTITATVDARVPNYDDVGPPEETVVCESTTAIFTVTQQPRATPAPQQSRAAPPTPPRPAATSTAADAENGEGSPVGVIVGSAAAIAIVVILLLVALAFRRRTQEPAVARPHAIHVPRLRTIEDPGSQLVESEPGRPLIAVRAMLDPGEITPLDEEHNDDNRL
jgi:hypothetical protein